MLGMKTRSGIALRKKHNERDNMTSGRRFTEDEELLIKQMRAQGASYNDLAKHFKCSKGTLSYRYGKGQKEKTLRRLRKQRNKFGGRFIKKVQSFNNFHTVVGTMPAEKPRNEFGRLFYSKVHKFKQDKNGIIDQGGMKMSVFLKEAKDHLWPKENNENRKHYLTTCKITGIKNIDLDANSGNENEGQLNHILPKSQGGMAEVENMEPVIWWANDLQGKMLKKDFLKRIHIVHKHNFKWMYFLFYASAVINLVLIASHV